MGKKEFRLLNLRVKMNDYEKLTEREKELKCIYYLDKIFEQNLDIHSFLIKVCSTIIEGFQYPQHTSVFIQYQNLSIKSPYFCESTNYLKENILYKKDIKGQIIVYYTNDIGKQKSFLDEEKLLLKSISKRISDYLLINQLKKDKKNISTQNNIFVETRKKILFDVVNNANFKELGIYSIYVIGSVKNAECGFSSDIDLIIYYDGNKESYNKTILWFDAWNKSVILSGKYKNEINNLDNLFDLHFITANDIAQKTSYAVMINSVNNSARLIKTIL